MERMRPCPKDGGILEAIFGRDQGLSNTQKQFLNFSILKHINNFRLTITNN